MNPCMSNPERALFQSFLRCSDRYLEFGSGGSTCLAANLVTKYVLSTDSSEEWLRDVESYCQTNSVRTMPRLFHSDIGPTCEWGRPAGVDSRDKWPNYHRRIWSEPMSSDCDLYMVDGRFRVACFMQVLLHSRGNALIMMHDFRSRPEYHVIENVAREIASAEDLSVFRPITGDIIPVARRILEDHEFDYS
jgi:hypothetical protein